MWDLALGGVILLAVTAALALCGALLGRCASAWVSGLAGVAVLALLAAFGLWLHGRLCLAAWLPFSCVALLGNWYLPGAGFLAGLVLGRRRVSRLRRRLIALALLVLAGYPVVRDLGEPALPARAFWSRDGVCLQSTPASSAPCGAATLLGHHGLAAGEKELIRLCLTRADGTPRLGVYRALKLKTQDTPWDVEIVGGSLEALFGQRQEPVLVLLWPREYSPDPWTACLRRVGWTPEVADGVVLYGLLNAHQADVGDPALGRHACPVDQLRRRWYGEGLRLVPRRQPAPSHDPDPAPAR